MLNTNILIKLPFRGTEERLKKVVNQWNNDRVRLVVSCDRHDTCDVPPMRQWAERQNVQIFFNPPEGKIAAVNANMEGQEFELLILASADMIPQEPDYDVKILNLFRKHFPEGDGVLHLNDGNAGNLLNTLCILDKKYYDRFGYIYHPSYQSLWCDNEFMEVSQKLQRAKYIDECIIKHEWDEDDPLVCYNQKDWLQDQFNFNKRKAKGFPK